MLPLQLDLASQANDDFSLYVSLSYPSGDPVDLTGVAAEFQLRAAQGATGSPLLDAPSGTDQTVTGVVVTDPPNGLIRIRILRAALAALNTGQATLQLAHELILTQRAARKVIACGQFSLSPGVIPA